jgi:hypothetical protein
VLSKLFQEFSKFLWNLFSFSLRYFYLLEGSKIFFMSSKYFIWIVHTSIYLWEFSWNFCDFLGIFRASKHFLAFSEFVFALKNILKKKQILSFRFEPSPKARPISSGPAVSPHEAHLSPAIGGHGHHGRPPPATLVVPYKGRGAEPPACPSSAAPCLVLPLRRRPSRAPPPASVPPSPVRRGRRLREQLDPAMKFATPSWTFATPSLGLKFTGAPPSMGARAGRHECPPPAISPSSSVQGRGSIKIPVDSSPFSLAHPISSGSRSPAPPPAGSHWGSPSPLPAERKEEERRLCA